MEYLKYISTVLITIVSLLFPTKAIAHPNKYAHANEIQEALGFEHPDVYQWLCFISSEMIDNHNPFYNQLKQRFPGFTCSHRCLFHWNYNGIPWTSGLENRVKAYTRWKYGNDNLYAYFPKMKEAFLIELRKEQKRRNRKINEKTEIVFGFASGGKDGSYANFFAAMAYDLHILGDYMSDNKDFKGLVELHTLINGIITTINRLDSRNGKALTKALKRELQTSKSNQQKADNIMAIIIQELPKFIQTTQNGSIKRRLEKRGFKFKKLESNWFQSLFL